MNSSMDTVKFYCVFDSTEHLWILKRHSRSVAETVDFTIRMVFLCCASGAVVRTFELSSEGMTLHRAMSSLNADVTCARYNHNGKIIASCSVDGGICLDVASSGELLSRFFYPAKNIAERRVNAVQFSSGSRFLASGGSDGCVRVWDLKTQEVSQTYSISASAVSSVSFSGYKDDFIVAGSDSGAISVCDVQSAENIGFLSVDPKYAVSGVTSVIASPHPYARQIVGSTYADGSVRVWDLHTGQLSAEFANQHDAAATTLAISPVSKVLLATGGLDRRVLFFDTLQRRELRSMDLNTPVSSLALCADGKTLAVGTTSGEVFVYDLRGAITPLYAKLVGDGGGGGGGAVIRSLQFATPSSDNSNATVFPTGQPVIATERVNGGLATLSVAPSHQSLDNGCQPEHPALFSPPTHAKQGSQNSFTISTNTPSASPPSNQPVTELEILQRHNVSALAGAYQKSCPSGLGESPRYEEPSLLSMLAEPSPKHNRMDEPHTIANSEPPLPITSPTSYSSQASSKVDKKRKTLSDEIAQLQVKMSEHHKEQQQEMAMLLKMVLDKYDTLLEENLRLLRENESLRAHLEQYTSNTTIR